MWRWDNQGLAPLQSCQVFPRISGMTYMEAEDELTSPQVDWVLDREAENVDWGPLELIAAWTPSVGLLRILQIRQRQVRARNIASTKLMKQRLIHFP